MHVRANIFLSLSYARMIISRQDVVVLLCAIYVILVVCSANLLHGSHAWADDKHSKYMSDLYILPHASSIALVTSNWSLHSRGVSQNGIQASWAGVQVAIAASIMSKDACPA